MSTEEIRAELNAILASRTFERSERLRRFLSYVCELTLRGESARINEYLIGNEVFERGADYSPNEDSVVRRQAHALRHKLQEYYSNEARDISIRIELPVGKYVPVFRRREAAVLPAAVVPAARGVESHRGRNGLVALALLGGVLLFAAGWMVGRKTNSEAQASAPHFAPAIQEIWGPWFADSAGAVVCFSNPLTTVIKHFQKEVPPDSLPRRFRLNGDADKFLRKTLDIPAGGHLYLTPSTAQGKMGEAISAIHLATLLSVAGLPVRATQSRFLSWDDLRSQNLILLGHNEANRWLDPLLEKLPLRLAATEGEKPRRIRNMQPAPGEPAEYRIEFPEDPNEGTQEYALVSMIPGVDGRRNLLLINGLNAQATQMAAEFLTTANNLEELVGRLRAAAPGHKGRWHFQIVLRAEVHDKVPTRASLVGVRVL